MVQTRSPRARASARPEPRPIDRLLAPLADALEWPRAKRFAGRAKTIAEPPEALAALLLACWPASAPGRLLLHVAPSDTRADRVARAARSFATGCEVLLLPSWDCLPYDRASPSRAVMGQRVGVLSCLTQPAPAAGRLVVATVEGLLQRIPPREVWPEIDYRIEPGQAIEDFKVWLIRAGYLLDERVDEPGEAAIRGEVADIFPAAGEGPLRLEVQDGRIGGIRRYDPLDQRTIGAAARLRIGPASEVILAERAVRAFIGAGADPPESDVLEGSARHRGGCAASSIASRCATSASRRCLTTCLRRP